MDRNGALLNWLLRKAASCPGSAKELDAQQFQVRVNVQLNPENLMLPLRLWGGIKTGQKISKINTLSFKHLCGGMKNIQILGRFALETCGLAVTWASTMGSEKPIQANSLGPVFQIG